MGRMTKIEAKKRIQPEVSGVTPIKGRRNFLRYNTEKPVQAKTIKIMKTCQSLVTPQRVLSLFIQFGLAMGVNRANLESL